jgi:hypothetical protein
MDKHERVDTALSDEPRGDDSLAKSGGGRQYASLVAQHCVGCGLLFLPQLALKLHLQRTAVVSFVTNDHTNAKVMERLANVIEAATWQPDVIREILGARDDAWLVVRRQPHRLCYVELWILKRSQPKQAVSKARMQVLLGDVDLIAKDDLHRRR